MFIAVAGNIGAGKTTLTELLARHYGWEPKYEAVATNPYMEDYYKDIHRWSFCLETFFLKERFRDLLAISQTDKDIIQDRSIFEGVPPTTRQWATWSSATTTPTWNCSSR